MRAFGEAAMASAFAAFLALPILGVRVVTAIGAVTLIPRLHWVVVGSAVVFVGRLALSLVCSFGLPKRTILTTAVRTSRAAAETSERRRLIIGSALALLAAFLPLFPFSDSYMVDLAITVLIYAMLGWGLNIVVGLAGLLDLGYVAFYAVGAYTFALLSHYFGLNFWECLPLAGFVAATCGVILGFPVLSMRGDYLAIVTLGFGEIIRIILLNWVSFTGGPGGILDIPHPTFFGWGLDTLPGAVAHSAHWVPSRLILLFYLILGLALLTNMFALRVRRLPLGRAWEALREDEDACRALGLNPTNLKLSAFGIGALFGGFAGCFFAARQGYISPQSFTFAESATVLAIVVLGGMGSQIGVLTAAILLVFLPELGREFAHYRMLVFGLAMVAIIVWRPGGLVAYRRPTILLGAAKSGS
ncbi:MAG TPA: high-affinity branched-chain amino acid ABC transporter permease LivM [Alphaproteobacteria bacterium]|nr:high-affinity branched-chain amino acid ABC transporter permease LivM [Alphaproteobacteria bacterium]